MRGGAWCPRSVIQEGTEEWLEINLHRPFRITATETQGRFGGGQGQEFAEFYQLQYWRQSLGNNCNNVYAMIFRFVFSFIVCRMRLASLKFTK